MTANLITITRRVHKLCPFVDEADPGRLVIVVTGDAPELHDLGRKVDAIGEGIRISHEDYTSAVAALIPGCGAVTFWQTGGWSVRVERGDPQLCAAVN